jgi:hypothetical protein
MTIITIYAGKTVDDIDRQCITCKHFVEKGYYCKVSRNNKIRFGFAPRCKQREEKEVNNEK